MKTAVRYLIFSCAFIFFFSPFELNGQCENFTVSISSVPAPPFNLCPGETITLISTVSGGMGPYTFNWSTGDVTPNTIVIPPFIGNVYLDVTDATGCVAYASIHVKASVWTVDILYVGLTYCQGDSMPLYAYPDFPAGTTFLWSTGETTNSIYISTSGTYSLTATAPGSACTTSVTEFIEMFFFPQPDPMIMGPSVLCSGQTATLTAQGSPNDLYNWSTGATTSSITINGPGLYSVIVTNSFGCLGSDTLEVLPGSAAPIISAPSVLCTGQSGTISITNASSYTSFLWSTGATTSSITINTPGTYSVTVTASGGCTGTGSVTVNSGSSNITLSGNVSPVTSCTTQNGAIDVTVTPSGSYTYSWSNGSNTQDINNLSAGTYTITVTDSGGCSSSSSYTVTSNVALPGASAIPTASTCDQNNGSIDLSVTPAGSYTYLWSNGTTTEDLSNILAGTYSVTVTSTASGCTATASITVPNNNITITIAGTTAPITSCTLPNGAIDITPSPSGTYTYAWSNGSTTQDLNNLTAGTYTVTISAGPNCIANSSFTVTNNTITPVPSSTTTAATCGQSNGAVDLTVNPAGTYSYLWSNGMTTEDLPAIISGTYSVTVTSADGCTAILNSTVQEISVPLAITGITTPNTLCISQNGAIDISVNPPGTYIYSWSNGMTTEDLNSIPAGVYSVSATLGLTCMASSSFIVDNNLPVINLTGTNTPNTSCDLPNGTIDLSVTTAGSYNYDWSNGATTEDLQDLTGGTYSVTVTGGNGCTATSTFDIINTASNFSVTESILPNTLCTSANGSIDLTPTPSGSYSFQWSNGATTEDLQNLPSGNYGVTVSDINNCSVVETYFVDELLSLPQISGLASPSTCGNNNGAIDINVTPLNGNIFLWSNGSSTEDQTNLASGTYTVTVTSMNGCTSSESFIVNNQGSIISMTALIKPNNSCINPNGSIDMTVSPAGSYSFVWSNGSTTEDLQNISAGLYVVTVTDIFNCAAQDTFILTSTTTPPLLSAIIIPTTCGANNGAIDLNVNPLFNNIFLWSTGAILEDLQNILPGSYSVTVTDSNGCQALDTFSVPNINNNFSISGLPLPNTSCSSPNGSIDLTVSPAGTYTYLWSNGSASEDLLNISAGIYFVTVTDITSCLSTASFTVMDNTTPITVSEFITPSSCNINNGAIDITPNLFNGNTFLWSNGATTEDLQNLNAGNFTVTITNANGCTFIDTIIVPAIGSSISLSALVAANSNCTAPNGAIDLSVSPPGSYTFQWSTGNFTEDLNSLLPGTYNVTVSDVNGCTSTASYQIFNQVIQPVILENISPTTCGNSNGQIDLTISPPGVYAFIWSNGNTNEDLQNIQSGIYTVTVMAINGCTANASFVVTDTMSSFTTTATLIHQTSCTGANGSIDVTVTPAGNYSFIWSNGAATEDLQFLPPGIYSVTVLDGLNCSNVSSFTIENNMLDLEVEESITPVLCGEANGSIDLIVTPSNGNTFTWSNGITQEDLQNILPGLYSVTITAQNGCTWSSSFSVPGSEAIIPVISVDLGSTLSDSITITLEINIEPGVIDTVMWFPESLFNCNQGFCLQQTIMRPLQPADIRVIVIDTNGCSGEAVLRLDIGIDPKVYIPNVFSPNQDGVNDWFTVYGNKEVKAIIEMQIFDRWGNNVFINYNFPPNVENYGWDGSFRNKDMNPAVFAYWAQVRFTDGSEGFYKGDVTLVR